MLFISFRNICFQKLTNHAMLWTEIVPMSYEVYNSSSSMCDMFCRTSMWCIKEIVIKRYNGIVGIVVKCFRIWLSQIRPISATIFSYKRYQAQRRRVFEYNINCLAFTGQTNFPMCYTQFRVHNALQSESLRPRTAHNKVYNPLSKWCTDL